MKDNEEAVGSAFLSKTAAANFLNTLDTSSMEKFKDSYVKNFMPFISKHYAKLDQGLLCKISAEEVQVEGQDVVQRLRAVANESFKFEKWMEKYNITESDIDFEYAKNKFPNNTNTEINVAKRYDYARKTKNPGAASYLLRDGDYLDVYGAHSNLLDNR
jgi:hypothetical protein